MDLVCTIGNVGTTKFAQMMIFIPNAFIWENIWKVDLSITVEIKVIMFTGYIKRNGTLIINKYKRPRLTFDLSANITQIGLPSICLYNIFLRNYWVSPSQISYGASIEWENLDMIIIKVLSVWPKWLLCTR